MATETAPEKPSDPVTEILTGALVVPICVFTEPGATEIEKSGETTVNRSPLLVRPPTVTTTLPVVAPLGTVTVMLVVLHALAAPAETPLNVTVLLPWLVPKLDPEMMSVEPETPEFTLRPAMTGAGIAVMVRLNGMEWLRFPLMPCTVSATVPADELAGTTSETCAEAFALIDREQDGEQVVPDGNPPIVTETDPEKPFVPVIETVTGALVVPACVLTDEGDSEMEKSGGGAVMVRLNGMEWLRFPLVPCTVSATVPADELAGTTSETCAEAFALIDREQDGEQVVPEGNPPIVTETIPEKPFVPVIETVTGALVVPACVLTDEGDSEMEKSGGGAVMVRLNGMEWLRFPLVPCTVSATVPADELAGTTNDTCAEALALIDREQDGEQVVPDGNPPIVTETDPEKPFVPVIETVTGALVVPPCVLTDEVEIEMEKSGVGGGDVVADPPPPPQPISRPAAANSQATRTQPRRKMQRSTSFDIAQLRQIVLAQKAR